MPIYTNIKKTCKQKGISVTKLEADLGFARSTIYKWDTHQPGIGKLKKVSDYLGVTMEYLLSDQKGYEYNRYEDEDTVVGFKQIAYDDEYIAETEKLIEEREDI